MASPHPKQLKLSENTGASYSTTTKDTPIPSKPYFDFSSSDFKEIVKMKAFVDKTKMIETIFKDSEIVLITAPRRFGKSTILDMVKTYVGIQPDPDGTPIERENESSNYKVFCENNLLIYQNTEFFNRHFATYPVIHVSFQSVGEGCKSYDNVLSGFKTALHLAFEQHPYLLNSDKLTSQEKEDCQMYLGKVSYKKLTLDDVHECLKFLSGYLNKHFNKKVFVLIDEYDAPINHAMFINEIKVDEVNHLISAIFSNLLKGNEYVERALLTGISYFATVGLSTVNNIEKYMFLQNHPYVDYYGLTEAEINKLLSDFNIKGKTKQKVKSYYNGYHTEKGTKIFSTWSVLHYLKSKILMSYWQESGFAVGLKAALHMPVIRYEIEKLFQNVPVQISILKVIQLDQVIKLKNVVLKTTAQNIELKDADLYLNFLLQQGYLAYKKNSTTGSERNVVIPNLEIFQEFRNTLKEYYSLCPDENMKKCAVVIDEISVDAKEEIYNELIKTFEQVISDFKKTLLNVNERVYHSLLFSVLCKTKLKLGDEMPLDNRRRIDLIMTRNDDDGNTKLGMIFEVKYDLDAKQGVEQIKTKKYYRVFEDDKFKNMNDKIYVGLNVDKNGKVTLAVLTNSLEIEDVKLYPM